MKSFYYISRPITHGIFCEESKNRFIALVKIQGNPVECYIPSSARLENFISMDKHCVLLVPTQESTARTRYTVLAVKQDRHNILLNTSLTNKALFHYLQYHKSRFYGSESAIFAERYIDGYKADLLINTPAQNKIIEIKSVLAPKETGIFPTVFSERANTQLEQLYKLIPQNAVEYCFVAINPRMSAIRINKEQKEYHALFKRCVERGMAFKGYSCGLIGRKVKIVGEIPVILD